MANFWPNVIMVFSLFFIHLFYFMSRCLYKYSCQPKKNANCKQDACANKDSLNGKDQWTLLLKDRDYSSYSVLALSPCHKIIAFGNLKGKIKLQDSGEWTTFSFWFNSLIITTVTTMVLTGIVMGKMTTFHTLYIIYTFLLFKVTQNYFQ